MGPCGLPSDIPALDAKHISSTDGSDLTQTITRISSGNRVAAVAAHTLDTQSKAQCNSGQKGRALLKGGGPASFLLPQASNSVFADFIASHCACGVRPIRPIHLDLRRENNSGEKGICIIFSLNSVSLRTISSKDLKLNG